MAAGNTRKSNTSSTASANPATAKRPTGKLTTGTGKKLNKMELAARDAAVRAELEAQVAAYADEVAALKAERDKAIANVNKAVQDELDNENKRIDRPAGTAGDGFSLRHAMGLADNVKLYRRCQRTVRRCVDKAGLDENKSFRGQDPAKLVNVYRAAKDLQPFLKRFVNDWATAEYVKMLLRNRRAHNARREREESPVDEDLMDIDLAELNDF